MKYLPILEELFSSDSIIFMAVGLIIAVIIGIKLNNTKKNLIGLCVCFAVYAFAEILSNVRSSYLLEIILLFTGTLAIGGMLGFLIGLIVSKLRK